MRAQLYNEARAAARVHHRGVVEIIDVGSLEAGSPRLIAALVRQAAALRVAHRAGVVHRNLKLPPGSRGEP